MALGPVKEAVSATIGSQGGSAVVSGTGSSLDGFILDVPAGSYDGSTGVRISYSDIQGHSFGEYFNPVSPLISVECGAGYSDEPMLLKIPVNVSDDQFAMAFIYDRASGRLEGLPSVERGEGYLTVATRHFSDVVVSGISRAKLDSSPEAKSDFQPGRDDWQFVNEGSTIAESGHCAGQSISSMWYFDEKRTKEGKPSLYGYYDNNLHLAGDSRDGTPGLWEDDVFGYRMASVVQKSINWQEGVKALGRQQASGRDKATFDEFKNSILVTNMPQFVYINSSKSGHAMVVYKVTTLNDNYVMHIADPNYPGIPRFIDLEQLPGNNTGTAVPEYRFEPYSGGDESFSDIRYIGTWVLIPKDDMSRLWADFEAGRIGSAIFDSYELVVEEYDDQGKKASETKFSGCGLNDNIIAFEVTNPKISIRSEDDMGLQMDDLTVMRLDGDNEIKKYPGEDLMIVLQPGLNKIGIAYYLPNADDEPEWAGFDWLYITYKAPEERKLLTFIDYYTSSPKNKHYEYTYYLLDANQPYNHTRHGTYKEWYQDGVLRAELSYKDGKQDGLQREYFTNGKLEWERQYVNGEINGYTRNYDRNNGFLIEETYYVDGLRDGVQREFSKDKEGQLIYETNYVKGKRDGKRNAYYLSGILAKSTSYKDDVKHGTETEYFESGKVRYVREYVNGDMTGSKTYKEDGTLYSTWP